MTLNRRWKSESTNQMHNVTLPKVSATSYVINPTVLKFNNASIPKVAARVESISATFAIDLVKPKRFANARQCSGQKCNSMDFYPTASDDHDGYAIKNQTYPFLFNGISAHCSCQSGSKCLPLTCIHSNPIQISKNSNSIEQPRQVKSDQAKTFKDCPSVQDTVLDKVPYELMLIDSSIFTSDLEPWDKIDSESPLYANATKGPDYIREHSKPLKPYQVQKRARRVRKTMVCSELGEEECEQVLHSSPDCNEGVKSVNSIVHKSQNESIPSDKPSIIRFPKSPSLIWPLTVPATTQSPPSVKNPDQDFCKIAKLSNISLTATVPICTLPIIAKESQPSYISKTDPPSKPDLDPILSINKCNTRNSPKQKRLFDMLDRMMIQARDMTKFLDSNQRLKPSHGIMQRYMEIESTMLLPKRLSKSLDSTSVDELAKQDEHSRVKLPQIGKTKQKPPIPNDHEQKNTELIKNKSSASNAKPNSLTIYTPSNSWSVDSWKKQRISATETVNETKKSMPDISRSPICLNRPKKPKRFSRDHLPNIGLVSANSTRTLPQYQSSALYSQMSHIDQNMSSSTNGHHRSSAAFYKQPLQTTSERILSGIQSNSDIRYTDKSFRHTARQRNTLNAKQLQRSLANKSGIISAPPKWSNPAGHL
ncbi:hypothetical protein O5D80_001228 [Batrachochytrium dendrobatidis]|nr:hypothetical protein O5D80_001228 [Batrachochytrium dendrobatidis]